MAEANRYEKIVKVDDIECDQVETACWTSAFGASFSGEVLALIRAGRSFEDAVQMGDAEAAAIIAGAAVRSLRRFRSAALSIRSIG